jgi:hypothetical protein
MYRYRYYTELNEAHSCFRLTLHNTAQSAGNTSKPMTITDPVYLGRKESMEKTFAAVRALDPPSSLFKWKTVSNLPAGELDDAIENMEHNAYKMHPTPQAAWISELIIACTAFRVARAAFRAFQKSRGTKGLQKKRT